MVHCTCSNISGMRLSKRFCCNEAPYDDNNAEIGTRHSFRADFFCPASLYHKSNEVLVTHSAQLASILSICPIALHHLFFSRYIDEGHNPELFTSHQLEQSLADYRAVQKKVQAYKVSLFRYWVQLFHSNCCFQNFRSQLIRQLEPVFPAEIKVYKARSVLQEWCDVGQGKRVT